MASLSPTIVSSRRPSLTEVAAASGVSLATASRVINRDPRFSVSEPVRQKVLRTARQMGYSANLVARSLASKRTNLVAVIGLGYGAASSPGVSEHAIAALNRRLAQAGYGVSNNFAPDPNDRFALPNWRVDGIVVVHPHEFRDWDQLDASGVPYVSINGRGGRGDAVEVDDRTGAQLALRHLVDLGHRRITYVDSGGVIAGGGPLHPSRAVRRDAYLEFMAEAGLPPCVRPLGHSYVGGYAPDAVDAATLMRLTADVDRATALLTYDHMLALIVLQAAHAAGVGVPADLSIACFNNEFPTELTAPALTVVDVPSIATGEVAAEFLLGRITGEASGPPIVRTLPESLVARGSTGPPPAA